MLYHLKNVSNLCTSLLMRIKSIYYLSTIVYVYCILVITIKCIINKGFIVNVISSYYYIFYCNDNTS